MDLFEWLPLAFRSGIASTVQVHENLSASRLFESLKKIAKPISPLKREIASRIEEISIFIQKLRFSDHLSKRCLHRIDIVAAVTP